MRHIEKRGRLVTAALAVGASLMFVAGCGTSAPTAVAVTTAAVTVKLPVVSCPTSVGGAPIGRSHSLPRTRAVTAARAIAARLSVYTDDQGRMELVAPKGWTCTAVYGQDGSGGVAVYPHGQALPSTWGAGWRLAATSGVTAVVGLESSACYTCTLAQACRLFPAADTTLRNYLGRQTCPVRPAAEKVTSVGAGIKGFADPPGTAGDGVPSGGRYPAGGVLTYHPGASSGSWLETCTVPGSDAGECAAILNSFVSWYGGQ